MTPNQLPPLPAIDPVLGHPEHHMKWTRPELAWIQQYATDYALTALAQQAQEPVAWLYVDTVGERYLCFSRPTGGGAITNLYTTPPAPQVPVCPRCDGSGTVTDMSDNSPDAHEVDVDCPHCNGSGALEDAYTGAVSLLKRATENYHRALPYMVKVKNEAAGVPAPQVPAPASELPDLNPEDFVVDVVLKQLGGFAPATTHGVRVTHKPSLISVVVDSERSQHRNRQLALEALRAITHHQAHPVPAPVVPEKRTVDPRGIVETADSGYVDGWNACIDAILALRPSVEPMTEWEIADIFERWDNTSGASMSDFVRMVEAHHGITAKAEGVKP